METEKALLLTGSSCLAVHRKVLLHLFIFISKYMEINPNCSFCENVVLCLFLFSLKMWIDLEKNYIVKNKTKS